ncbi:uncharacterized protein [Tenebrio molitor]|uniref:uncharacterized protein isoform X3 n=1 Tax=Tenebrio molitor TaxID=7067 RepID=UPI0036248AFE
MSGVCSEVPFNVLKLFKVWTVLLTFSPTMSGYTWSSTAKSALDHNLGLSPVFDDFTIREVEATEGQTLLLPCTVRYLGDKVVSWIRSRDLHILTSGPFTFSSDSRFEPVPSSAGDFWGLRIRVSGGRKLEGSNSKWVGQALIKGPSEVYVRDGSLVTFTCEISPLSVASLQSGAHGVFMTAKPKVRWLHDNKELLFEASDPHISMRTLYGERSLKVIGVLKISKVSWRDSGQYTCLQMSVKPDSIRLFVVESEHSEAMQRDFPPLSSANQYLFNFGYIVLSVLLCLNFPT